MENFFQDFEEFDLELEKTFRSHKFTNLLIRYSDEIGTKSDKIQKEMEKELLRSINISLGKNGIILTKFYHEKGRLIVSFREEDSKKATLIIRNITGISSVSPVLKTDLKIDHIVNKTLDYIKPFYNSNIEFKINVKYAYKSVNQNPIIITRKCLKELSENYEDYKKEKHKTSTFKAFVEIRKEFTYIYHLKIPGTNPGLPIDLKSGIVIGILYRFHDLVLINRMIRRGFQILPVIFLTNKNRFYHDKQVLKTFIEPIYAIDCLFAFVIDIQGVLEQFSGLYGDSVCYYCRFFRLKMMTLIKKEYEALVSSRLKTLDMENKISNLFFDISYVNYSGMAETDNDSSYCPVNEDFLKNDTILQELIFYPLISMSKQDIIRDLKDIHNAYRMTADSIKNSKDLIDNILFSDIQNKICDYKKELDFKERDKFLKTVTSKDFELLVRKTIDNSKLIKIF